jgi:hypothetical protein
MAARLDARAVEARRELAVLAELEAGVAGAARPALAGRTSGGGAHRRGRAAAAAQQRRRLSGCPGAGCMLLEGPGPCSAHGRRQPTPVHQCAREMARCLPCGEPQHRRPSAAAADPVRRARLQLEDLAAAERRVRSLLVDPAVADSEDELF